MYSKIVSGITYYIQTYKVYLVIIFLVWKENKVTDSDKDSVSFVINDFEDKENLRRVKILTNSA